jgi:hypothetical protein
MSSVCGALTLGWPPVLCPACLYLWLELLGFVDQAKRA